MNILYIEPDMIHKSLCDVYLENPKSFETQKKLQGFILLRLNLLSEGFSTCSHVDDIIVSLPQGIL